MSYQVTLNSRNVLVPIALTGRDGEPLISALGKLDTATALMIQVSASGAFTQEFFPLKITHLPSSAYLGLEWELRVQNTSEDLSVYYLGIPDMFFSDDGKKPSARSLSIQVVGTSPLTGRETFSGGEDITLQTQVASPLIPGFLNLSELFFPTLLPQNFIAGNTLEVFEFQAKQQLVLMSTLQMDASARVPVSLEKHWEPNNWIHAVVENLAPDMYFIIQGGCFFTRNRKITHWFGGSIGLEDKDFRTSAMQKIRTMGTSENGAWVFWLEPQGPGVYDPVALARSLTESEQSADGPRMGISIRHPILHRLLAQNNPLSLPGLEAATLAGLPARQSVAALAKLARILASYQTELQQARWEPAHAVWSQLASPGAFPLEMLTEPSKQRPVSGNAPPRSGLEADIRDLYQFHGEILRALESMFEKTYGYSAWDAVGEPLRETLIGYLTEATPDAHGILGFDGLGQGGAR